MIESLLVANRGEIASRIIRTAQGMGIRTVAIFSDADVDAPHVTEADEAWPVGPAAAAESYLNIDAILSVAKKCRASAIHPGYGFLSENAKFAQACIDAGIVFVGPSADAIAAMGSKSAAKKLMTDANVAVVPGYHGDAQDIDTLTKEADQCGYPLLLKASAGGGGKGMRIVEHAEDLPSAIAAVKRESSAAFGNDHLLLERYLLEPRHIEIQIFGDTQGQFVHLFERDCSIQRRHQKIIEEAPAPGLTDEQRSTMGAAAIDAAKAINYCGAGTVEFIVEDDQFYFMEMNTRLQVEHPVTEMITGYDLVEWQLKVAAGEPLPVSQNDIKLDGHSIEVRLYAEDTENQFLPASGTIEHLSFPLQTPHCRVDSGITNGSTVSIHYDPMLAKLISHAATREEALERLLGMLDETQILGVRNNLDYLYRIADSQPFRSADLTTSFIDKHHRLLTRESDNTTMYQAAAAAWLSQQQNAPSSAWQLNDGWRLNSNALFGCYLQLDTAIHFVKVETVQNEFHVTDGETLTILSELVSDPSSDEIRFSYDGTHHTVAIASSENYLGVTIQHQRLVFTRHHQLPIDAAAQQNDSGLTAPMPGKVLSVMVSSGDKVNKGDPLVIVEAMKMEHTVAAPHDGKIGNIWFAEGDNVVANAILLELS